MIRVEQAAVTVFKIEFYISFTATEKFHQGVVDR